MDNTRESVTEESRRMRENFVQRNPNIPFPQGANNISDPGAMLNMLNSSSTTSGKMQLWRLLPAIQHLPESFISSLSEEHLFQLNSALARETKHAGRMQASARLTGNLQQLLANPTLVPGGYDDRRDHIHPSRFLGGVCASAADMWLRARETIGSEGVLAVGCYDLDSIGFGGCVTPKGWIEIHKPGSTELKLKLFYMPNVGASSSSAKQVSMDEGAKAFCFGDTMKEIADLDSFKSALHAAREAMASALPWNKSIAAIHGFMANSDFCKSDLAGNSKRAAILCEFVDYIFGRNALNWDNKQPFLSTDDLSHVWATWKGKRASTIQSSFSDREKVKKDKKPFEKDDICRRYNTPGGCQFKPEDCKTPSGIKLRHVCNAFLPGQRGKKCEKDHARPNHK